MFEVRVYRGREVFDAGLAGRVVEFDRRNMRRVWERAGMEFPEANRRKGLEGGPTFVVAFEGREIAGYVEYLRSWNDPRYIYVGSLQIDERHRHSTLILRLLDEFRSLASRSSTAGARDSRAAETPDA